MEAKRVSRRRHSREFKLEVLDACCKPGASVAAVALANGLNANVVHRWRRQAAATRGPVTGERACVATDEFVALPLPAQLASAALPDIRIELRRGPNCVSVSWPLQGARDCAAWLREWLR